MKFENFKQPADDVRSEATGDAFADYRIGVGTESGQAIGNTRKIDVDAILGASGRNPTTGEPLSEPFANPCEIIHSQSGDTSGTSAGDVSGLRRPWGPCNNQPGQGNEDDRNQERRPPFPPPFAPPSVGDAYPNPPVPPPAVPVPPRDSVPPTPHPHPDAPRPVFPPPFIPSPPASTPPVFRPSR